MWQTMLLGAGLSVLKHKGNKSSARQVQKIKKEEIDEMLEKRSLAIKAQSSATISAQRANYAAGGTEGSYSVLKGVADEAGRLLLDEQVGALEAKRLVDYEKELTIHKSRVAVFESVLGSASSVAGGAGGIFGGGGAGGNASKGAGGIGVV